MSDVIECCLSNANGDLSSEMSSPGRRVREDACLQRCGVCYDRPFAVVNGHLVEADSPSALPARIREELDG